MNSIDRDIKNAASDLEYQQRRLNELQTEKYAALTRRGMAMVHLPDSNVKLIVPAAHIEALANNWTFVISEDSTDKNTSGTLTPFAGQLNVTYFTGD